MTVSTSALRDEDAVRVDVHDEVRAGEEVVGQERPVRTHVADARAARRGE